MHLKILRLKGEFKLTQNEIDPSDKYKIPADYLVIFFICVSFIIIALVLDSPRQILLNYIKINTSRSVLVTDYVALGGIGAALVNSAISGFLNLFLLIINKRSPNGHIIASLFVTIGFSLFGKNLFNTIPIMFGVWLYGRCHRVKFANLLTHAMFSGTIAPLVSEIAFFAEKTDFIYIFTAYAVGILAGFIFPVITESAKRMHRGYCLYNGGTAGGFIATFTVGILRSGGFEILPENIWDTSSTFYLATLSYSIAAALIIYGFVMGGKPVNVCKRYFNLLKERDMNNNDYFARYGNICYVNIGIMCIVATSLMLFLEIPINGPVLGGILTVAGFAAAGKHLVNTAPLIIGSVSAAYFNYIDTTASGNALAILFSTGLAPICGKHGWFWGIVAGFLHVSVAIFIGNLNGGLNLYNNGFAGGFVAITLVPIIVFIKELFDDNRPADNSGEAEK